MSLNWFREVGADGQTIYTCGRFRICQKASSWSLFYGITFISNNKILRAAKQAAARLLNELAEHRWGSCAGTDIVRHAYVSGFTQAEIDRDPDAPMGSVLDRALVRYESYQHPEKMQRS